MPVKYVNLPMKVLFKPEEEREQIRVEDVMSGSAIRLGARENWYIVLNTFYHENRTKRYAMALNETDPTIVFLELNQKVAEVRSVEVRL